MPKKCCSFIICRPLLLSLVLASFVFLGLPAWGMAEKTQAQTQAQPQVEMAKLHLKSGESIHLRLEIAETEAEQEQGLMFRQAIEENTGMLFIFSHSRMAAFWMKNTEIALDLLYLDKDGQIVQIVEGMQPHDLTMHPSNRPVLAALELAAGMVEKHKIQVGDELQHRFFEKK